MGIDDYVTSDWENGKFTIVSDGKWGSLNGHPLYVITDKQDGDQSIYTVPIKLNGEERTMIVGFDTKNKIYIAQPSIIGKDGIEKVIKLDLTDDENAQYMQCVKAISDGVAKLK